MVTMAGKDTQSKKDAQSKPKKFGKQERSVPHNSEKASKWYPAYEEPSKRKVSFDSLPNSRADLPSPDQTQD